jgi:hypothetical protein
MELNSAVRVLAYRVKEDVAIGSSGSTVETVAHLICALVFVWKKRTLIFRIINNQRYDFSMRRAKSQFNCIVIKLTLFESISSSS